MFEVPASMLSAALARRLLGELLRGWGTADIVEYPELVVSELVTNAVRHAPGSASHMVEVVGQADLMEIAVVDESPLLPPVRRTRTDAWTVDGCR